MDKFMKVGTAMAGAGLKALMNDPAQEQLTTASDRVGGDKSTNTDLASQAQARQEFGFYPAQSNDDRTFAQCNTKDMKDTNPMKLIELNGADWVEADLEQAVLISIELPQAFYDNASRPARGPTRPWGNVRTNFSFQLQANAVTGSTGALMVYYVPPGVDTSVRQEQTIRLQPSAELNIGVDTTATIYIPYTHYQQYVETDSTNLGRIEVMVWCRLSVPTGSAGVVTPTVWGAMDQLDLQLPRAITAEGYPPENRIVEGFGCMNLTGAHGTRNGLKLAIDNQNQDEDPTTSGMEKPITDMRDLAQVYVPLNTTENLKDAFKTWDVSATRNTSVLLYNINPITATQLSRFIGNGYEMVRGSIVLRLTVYCSPLHKGRLRMTFAPNTTRAYSNQEAENLLNKILDIGVNSSVELVIPYTYTSWLRYVSNDFGRLQIIVANRLSAANNCAPVVRVLTEMKFGPDIEFTVPVDRGIRWQNDPDTKVTEAQVTGSTEEAAAAAGLLGNSQVNERSGAPMSNQPLPTMFNQIIARRTPMGNSHMTIDTLFARAQRVGTYTMVAGVGQIVSVPVPVSGFMSYLKAFAYWHGRINFHIYNRTTETLQVAHTYRKVSQPSPSQEYITALGSVFIRPQQYLTVEAPWYTEVPAIPLNPEPNNEWFNKPFGSLYLHPFAAGKVEIYISFAKINLYQPLAIPKKATLRTLREFVKATGATNTSHSTLVFRSNFLKLSDRMYVEEAEAAIKEHGEMNGWIMNLDEEENRLAGGWQRDLTADGDVESNPGPPHDRKTRNIAIMTRKEKPEMIGVRVQPDKIISYTSKGFHHMSRNILKWNLEMHIYITQEEYDFLVASVIKMEDETCFYLPNSPFRKLQHKYLTFRADITKDLTVCGDVEKNPGPSVLIYECTHSSGLYAIAWHTYWIARGSNAHNHLIDQHPTNWTFLQHFFVSDHEKSRINAAAKRLISQKKTWLPQSVIREILDEFQKHQERKRDREYRLEQILKAGDIETNPGPPATGMLFLKKGDRIIITDGVYYLEPQFRISRSKNPVATLHVPQGMESMFGWIPIQSFQPTRVEYLVFKEFASEVVENARKYEGKHWNKTIVHFLTVENLEGKHFNKQLWMYYEKVYKKQKDEICNVYKLRREIAIQAEEDEEGHDKVKQTFEKPLVATTLMEHYQPPTHDVTMDGDVELNPGPRCKLVYLPRGLYRHYGVEYDGQVFHMQSENILDAAITGKVKIETTPTGPQWKEEVEVCVTDFLAQALSESVGKIHIFSASDNCETFAKEALGIDSVTQARALATMGLIIVAVTAAHLGAQGEPGTSMREKVGNLFGKSKEKVNRAATSAWKGVTSFFTEELVKGIKCDVAKTICKILIRCVCYAILFCSSPGLLTGAAVGTLIAMDLTSIDGLSTNVKDLCSCLMEGDLCGAVGRISDLVYENNKEKQYLASNLRATLSRIALVTPEAPGSSDPFRTWNSGTLAFRNLEYWLSTMERFWRWLKRKFSPGPIEAAQNYMSNNSEKIMKNLVHADNLLMSSSNTEMLQNEDYQKDVTQTAKTVLAIKYIALTGGNAQLAMQSGMLVTKLQRVPLVPANDKEIFRMEPIGIWISGGGGCGKSYLSMNLLTAVKNELTSRKMKIPDNGLFVQPAGSEYMDGYTGQWMHIIDDMAQSREEEDTRYLCQMISSVPCVVPMAALDQKGTKYKSEIVVATTNRTDFISKVLHSTDAYSRRFPFKYKVTVTEGFETKEGKLDAAKATMSGAGAKGHCWQFIEEETVLFNRPKVFDIATEAKRIADEYERRMTLCTKVKEQFATLKGPKPVRDDIIDWNYIKELMHPKVELGTEATPEPTPEAPKKDKKREPKVSFVNQAFEDDDGFCTIDFNNEDDDDDERDVEFEKAKMTLGADVLETPFQSLKTRTPKVPKVEVTEAHKSWFAGSLSKAADWLKKSTPWFMLIAVVLMVIRGILGLYSMIQLTRRLSSKDVDLSNDTDRYEWNFATDAIDETERERAYSKMTTAGKAKVNLKNIVLKPQAPGPDEFAHLFKFSAALTIDNRTIYGLALGGHEILVYKHFLKMHGYVIDHVTVNGLPYKPAPGDYTVTTVQHDIDGEICDTDYVIVDFEKMPYQVPSGRKYLDNPVPADKNIRAIMSYPGSNFAQACSKLELSTHAVDYGYVDEKPKQITHEGIKYMTPTFDGMCGALIIQKLNGAWKIVGMHHAGDKYMFGYGMKIIVPPKPEGVVTEREKMPKPYFTPSRTKLKKSPLYGIVETTMEPAPLTSKDPRIEADVGDNLTKFGSEKYRINEFHPDESLFEETKLEVTQKLFTAIGASKLWTLEEALDGGGNPIDPSTSPGRKYVEKGLRKTDLFRREGDNWFVNPMFRTDVEKAYQDILEGKATTEFVATLKDELRPKEKVKLGKTRCIEACPVDYTVAFRMVCGPIFKKIYECAPTQTGLAVGCCPYLDFHGIARDQLPTWLAVDFTRFDGSLSYRLMKEAVEVLASCSEYPELVQNAMTPVLISRHVVFDEIWTVVGGMPSGSPATTVLNSVCNLLVCRYTAKVCGVQNTNENFRCVTYGDDVIASTSEDVDWTGFAKIVFEAFGMSATSADKTGDDIRTDPHTATFLKRHFRFFPGTTFVTGRLTIDSMMQKIQWCRGLDEFKQQLESFFQELVLHGERVYCQVQEDCKPRLAKYNILFPDFKPMHSKVYGTLFA